MAKAMTFETSYRRYPFAPLVEFGVNAAAWLQRKFGAGSRNVKKAHRAGDKSGAAIGHAA